MTTTNYITDNFPKNAAAFTSVILKGIGQIMLQENRITGLLFLVGIFYGSTNMGFAALLATICGTTTAYILKYNQQDIEKGLYGFSAALVGVGLILFLKPVILSWILIVVGSSLATVIQHFFIERKISVFTLPFVLVTWMIIYFIRMYYPDIIHIPITVNAAAIDNLSFGLNGFAQVIFQDNRISGLFFFIAVCINSPIAALYGFAAGVLSAIIALNLSVPVSDVGIGLFSYNAVLCAIAFAGYRLKDLFWILLAVLLSLWVSLTMDNFNILPLTFPFVVACMVALAFKNKTFSVLKTHLKRR